MFSDQGAARRRLPLRVPALPPGPDDDGEQHVQRLAHGRHLARPMELAGLGREARSARRRDLSLEGS